LINTAVTAKKKRLTGSSIISDKKSLPNHQLNYFEGPFFTFTCDKHAQKIAGLPRFYRSGYPLPLPQEGKKPRFTAKNDPVFATWGILHK